MCLATGLCTPSPAKPPQVRTHPGDHAAPAGQAPHAGAVQVLRCAEAEVGTALRWSLAAGMDIVCPASHVPSQEGCTDAGDWRDGGGDSPFGRGGPPQPGR